MPRRSSRAAHGQIVRQRGDAGAFQVERAAHGQIVRQRGDAGAAQVEQASRPRSDCPAAR
ncbi:hypothetical protein [Citrobacter freundii]|uniref:hypothetical protein n=1 Tax=Citrobacter freundii TaxID=546 RepID=UPI0032AFFEF1